MNRAINKIGYVTLFFTLASTATLAGDASHGGLGWVCRDDTGKATSAQLYEIAKAPKTFSIDPKFIGISHEVIFEIFANRLRNASDWGNVMYSIFQHSYLYLFENRVELPDGERIQFDSAAFKDVPTYHEDDPCKAEMIGHTLHGITRIDMELYNLLDSVNRLAFWIHETSYFIATQITEPETATRVRNFTLAVLNQHTTSSELSSLVDNLLPKKLTYEDPYGIRKFTVLLHSHHSTNRLGVATSVFALEGGWKFSFPEVDAISLERITVQDLRTGESPKIITPSSPFYPEAVVGGFDDDQIWWFFPNRGDLRHKVIELVIRADTEMYGEWTHTKISTFAGSDEDWDDQRRVGYSQGNQMFEVKRDDQVYIVRLVIL